MGFGEGLGHLLSPAGFSILRSTPAHNLLLLGVRSLRQEDPASLGAVRVTLLAW